MFHAERFLPRSKEGSRYPFRTFVQSVLLVSKLQIEGSDQLRCVRVYVRITSIYLWYAYDGDGCTSCSMDVLATVERCYYTDVFASDCSSAFDCLLVVTLGFIDDQFLVVGGVDCGTRLVDIIE